MLKEIGAPVAHGWNLVYQLKGNQYALLMEQTTGMMGGSTMTMEAYESGQIGLVIVLQDGSKIEVKNSEPSAAAAGLVGYGKMKLRSIVFNVDKSAVESLGSATIKAFQVDLPGAPAQRERDGGEAKDAQFRAQCILGSN